MLYYSPCPASTSLPVMDLNVSQLQFSLSLLLLFVVWNCETSLLKYRQLLVSILSRLGNQLYVTGVRNAPEFVVYLPVFHIIKTHENKKEIVFRVVRSALFAFNWILLWVMGNSNVQCCTNEYIYYCILIYYFTASNDLSISHFAMWNHKACVMHSHRMSNHMYSHWKCVCLWK